MFIELAAMNARVQREGLQLKIVRHQDLLPNKKPAQHLLKRVSRFSRIYNAPAS
jgi:hypothetical protein